MKIWKLCCACFVSFLLLKPTHISRACGGWDWSDADRFSFFDPALSNMKAFSPLYFSLDRYYEYEWTTEQARYQDNIQAWEKLFHDQLNPETTRHLVYESSLARIDSLLQFHSTKDLTWIPRDLDSWTATVLKRKRSQPLLQYLAYAKACEPHATYNPNAWGAEPRDLEDMEGLIQIGQAAYARLKHRELRLRYAYQVIRLAHYAGQHERVLELFEELAEPLAEATLMYYWTLGHKAGALKRLGQEVEAAYLFSRVFAECPSKRIPAWQSFYISTDENWEACLARCQNDEERANLYFMRGLGIDAEGVAEMENIARLAPHSDKLRLLLAREINKLEYELFEFEFRHEFPMRKTGNGEEAGPTLAQVLRLLHWVGNYQATTKPADAQVWQMAEGYLNFMLGDMIAAKQLFLDLKNQDLEPAFQAYPDLYLWLIDLAQLESIGPEEEETLFARYEALSLQPDPHALWPKALRFLKQQFSRHYERQENWGKAFLAVQPFDQLYYEPDLQVAESILANLEALETRKKTAFEKLILGNEQKMHYQALEIKGTMLMGEHRFAEAVQAFEQIPVEVWSRMAHFTLPADPFFARLQDCIECDDELLPDQPYTKLRLAREILRLQSEMQELPYTAARNAFLLGNALYNISYYGHAWMATRYFRSGSPDYGSGNPNFFLGEAEAYFRQAAAVTSDREFAAKALFFAEKARQKSEAIEEISSQQADFSELSNGYRDTHFYQQAVRACSFLRYAGG